MTELERQILLALGYQPHGHDYFNGPFLINYTGTMRGVPIWLHGRIDGPPSCVSPLTNYKSLDEILDTMDPLVVGTARAVAEQVVQQITLKS